MGVRGPIPKRSDQRRRVNAPAIPLTESVAGLVSEQPKGDPDWHPLAADWYRSLADSGQSCFYEPSDWALARAIAEAMSRDLKPRMVPVAGALVEATMPVPGASLQAWMKAMTVLLATEGDRRRLSLELKRAEAASEVPDGVADFAKYQDRLTG